jgi:hypothetical protein
MKLATIGAAMLLVLGATVVGADSWFGGRSLPKAIDSPIVRKHVKEYHKTGKRQRHPRQSVQLELAASSLARA